MSEHWYLYSTFPHNLFFQVRKTASYGAIAKLWGDAASYGDLLRFHKIEAIPVDFLAFLESKNRFLAFLYTKWREKQIGDWNSARNNGSVRKREIIQGYLILESL